MLASGVAACGLRSAVGQPNCGDGKVEPGDICHFRGESDTLELSSPVGWEYFLLADVTDDGKDDVLWACDELMIFASQGDGTFEHVASLDPEDGLGSMATVEFADGGPVHLVMAVRLDGDEVDPSRELVLFAGDGSGEFVRRASAPLAVDGAWDIAVADFEGNGGRDVAVWAADPGRIIVIPVDEAGFGEPSQVAAGAPAENDYVLRVGDFDGDGRSDLLVRTYVDGPSLLEVRYGGRLGDPVHMTVDGVWVSAIADMNGDGVDDVVGVAEYAVDDDVGGYTELWTLHGEVGQGLGVTEWTQAKLPTRSWCATPRDLDLDGVMDLALQADDGYAFSPGYLVLARGDDEGGFREVVRFEHAGTCVAGELNGDGVPDFLRVGMSDLRPVEDVWTGTVLSDP
jgi:hypothetical protein